MNYRRPYRFTGCPRVGGPFEDLARSFASNVSQNVVSDASRAAEAQISAASRQFFTLPNALPAQGPFTPPTSAERVPLPPVSTSAERVALPPQGPRRSIFSRHGQPTNLPTATVIAPDGLAIRQAPHPKATVIGDAPTGSVVRVKQMNLKSPPETPQQSTTFWWNIITQDGVDGFVLSGRLQGFGNWVETLRLNSETEPQGTASTGQLLPQDYLRSLSSSQARSARPQDLLNRYNALVAIAERNPSEADARSMLLLVTHLAQIGLMAQANHLYILANRIEALQLRRRP